MDSTYKLRPPSMQALVCFEAAERLGSLTQAARELHLTQGAVSRQLIALEERLHVRLLVRQRSGLVLTPAGSAFLSEIRPLLSRLERAIHDLRSHGGRGGRLRLSVASTFATHWLIPRLPDFTAAHPDVTLDLATRIGAVDFARVDVDAAITFVDAAPWPATGVRLTPLRLSPQALPSLARQLGRGRGAPWLDTAPLLVNVSVPGAWAAWAETAGVPAERLSRLRARGERTGPRYDLLSMASNAALAGLGVALLPDFLNDRRLRALSNVVWATPGAYYLSYPTQNAELPALSRFKQWLLGQVQQPSVVAT